MFDVIFPTELAKKSWGQNMTNCSSELSVVVDYCFYFHCTLTLIVSQLGGTVFVFIKLHYINVLKN